MPWSEETKARMRERMKALHAEGKFRRAPKDPVPDDSVGKLDPEPLRDDLGHVAPGPVPPPVRKRIPMGVPAYKLAVDEIPGYVTRWFNDSPGRIETAIQGGYEFVSKNEVGDYGTYEVVQGNSDPGTKVSRIVGVLPDGATPMRGYLMKIKKEWYSEDEDMKQRSVDKVDESIRRGSLYGEPGKDGRYVKQISVKDEVK